METTIQYSKFDWINRAVINIYLEQPFNPAQCLHNMLPQRKICMDAIWGRRMMDMSCYWQKLNCLKIVFLIESQYKYVWSKCRYMSEEDWFQILYYYNYHATTISYILLFKFFNHIFYLNNIIYVTVRLSYWIKITYFFIYLLV